MRPACIVVQAVFGGDGTILILKEAAVDAYHIMYHKIKHAFFHDNCLLRFTLPSAC